MGIQWRKHTAEGRLCQANLAERTARISVRPMTLAEVNDDFSAKAT
jgi:hypothetical protein